MICRCGKTPELVAGHENHGQGDTSHPVWYVECSCGMRGKVFAHGYNGSEDECRAKAVEFWNVPEYKFGWKDPREMTPEELLVEYNRVRP